MSEGRRKEVQRAGRRREKSLMRPGCAASSSSFAHSTIVPSHLSSFGQTSLSLLFFPSSQFLKPLFLSCMSFSFSHRFPFPLTPNSTYQMAFSSINSKTAIPLLVTEQTQSGLCGGLKRSLLEQKLLSFQIAKKIQLTVQRTRSF